jgi:ubiquinone biosynthesis monooxygenase Coq7
MPNPAGDTPDGITDDTQRRHAAGLMRINHAGEVCAQALYLGQAALSRSPDTRQHLRRAADEEADHLAWCAARIDELGERPSMLNPLWYAGAFTIGAAAGAVGDAVSLGFIVETERQVEAHLGDHLEHLPENDARSRAIVAVMQADEARHGANAKAAGARELPAPLPRLMQGAADVMRWLAYRI